MEQRQCDAVVRAGHLGSFYSSAAEAMSLNFCSLISLICIMETPVALAPEALCLKKHCLMLSNVLTRVRSSGALGSKVG